MKWNRAEVIATSVVCAAAVGFTITAVVMYSEPREESAPFAASDTKVVAESPTIKSSPLGDRGNYTVEVVTPPPATEIPTPIIVSEPASAPALPPCANEDSDNCYWDAATMGNGLGMSFVALNGQYYYLEGSGLNTRIEGDPFALWPTGPVIEYDPGVLMCGTGAAPAEDTDPNGNHWAYCEPALVTK